MERMEYDDVKYDGVLVCSLDKDLKYAKPQLDQFLKILLRTLSKIGVVTHSKGDVVTFRISRGQGNHVEATLKIENETLRFLFYNIKYFFPTVELICRWNEEAQKMFEEEGIYGLPGLKDRGIIENLLVNIEDSVVYEVDQYPTITKKASHIWQKIARYQAFNNGNKRTALKTMSMFLNSNFYELSFKKGEVGKDELYKFSKKIAAGEVNEDDIEQYIQDHIYLNFGLMKEFFLEFIVDKR
ncbi:type II toxin-antitoxin system death-on-curing family toxin [Liquorilactobacillus oeni]|nr:type II toxin-antitoxin system death-on-curing family toxin [Liquorilactobacillus oeni]